MTEAKGGASQQRLIDPRAAGPRRAHRSGRSRCHGQTIRRADHQRGGREGNQIETRRDRRAGDPTDATIALGHWVAGRLDPAEFPADPANPGSRRYRTGDLVLLRDDGMLVPIGRADRQAKINGVRVEPGDTEAALRSLPGVADVAVLVHGDGEAPILVVTSSCRPRGEPATNPAARSTCTPRRSSNAAPRRALAARLPPQQVPAQIRVVAAIPLLPSMKPDFSALRALLATENPPGVLGRIWIGLRACGRHILAAGSHSRVEHNETMP